MCCETSRGNHYDLSKILALAHLPAERSLHSASARLLGLLRLEEREPHGLLCHGGFAFATSFRFDWRSGILVVSPGKKERGMR